MVEQPVARFVGNSKLQSQLDQYAGAIHKLKLLSAHISHALAYMQHEATKKGGESLGSNKLIACYVNIYNPNLISLLLLAFEILLMSRIWLANGFNCYGLTKCAIL